MISLSQLIQVAGFPEETKKDLLAKLDSLSLDKKYMLEETCWTLIIGKYKNKIQYEFQKKAIEIAKGEKEYTKDDFVKVEENLFNELIQKLEVAENQKAVRIIREKLIEHIDEIPVAENLETKEKITEDQQAEEIKTWTKEEEIPVQNTIPMNPMKEATPPQIATADTASPPSAENQKELKKIQDQLRTLTENTPNQ